MRIAGAGGEWMVSRVLLLVDDEANILSALKRLFRRDDYQILSANGGAAALDLIAGHSVGVVISDQRMPGMTGTQFLSQVRRTHPDTVRIVLSGYTDFNTVAGAINQGDIYKFIAKPWEDDQVRAAVREAFERYEMGMENRRLTAEVQVANESLAYVNKNLERLVDEKTRQVTRNWRLLEVSQEILAQLPFGVIGIDRDGLIVVANQIVFPWLDVPEDTLVGSSVEDVLSDGLRDFLSRAEGGGEVVGQVSLNGDTLAVRYVKLGLSSKAQGCILVVMPRKQLWGGA